jgi:hypothetical protein
MNKNNDYMLQNFLVNIVRYTRTNILVISPQIKRFLVCNGATTVKSALECLIVNRE